jgi:micrococcal nuclease
LLRIISLILVLSVVAVIFTACGEAKPSATDPSATNPTEAEHIDYVSQVKLDLSSSSKKQEVKWGQHSHIDGDTSHFEVDRSVDSTGVIKARYLAIDTPESTGQIEEWGKAASRFTKEKLSTAAAILVESDSDRWNYDGNGRYLVWVWYKPTADAEYRNLNIELLQNGLGASSKASDSMYGETAVAAIAQANREKLYMFSGEKDPEFPYGEASSITLRELRTNVEKYNGQKVTVEGIITYNSDFEAYIESYDGETDMYYGMQIFYGYNTQLIPVLAQGSMVRIMGVVTEFYGTYQISSLSYNRMKPEDPANTSQISKGNEIPYPLTDPDRFYSDVTVDAGEEQITKKFNELSVSTSISMKELRVRRVYTTTNPDSDDCGAMTLTCEADGVTVSVRTEVLKDENGEIITADAYDGKLISVKGVVDHYEGNYQIRVYTADDITVH